LNWILLKVDNGVIQDAIILSFSSEVVFVNYKHSEVYCKAFGNQLRKLRQSKGLSMRQLAAEADMEYSQLSKIERGIINTTISTVHSIAITLDIPEKEFFDFKV